MSEEYPNIPQETIDELETLSSLSDAGWVVDSPPASNRPDAIEVHRHRDRLSPTEENIINRLNLSGDQGGLKEGYTLYKRHDRSIAIGYDGSDTDELSILIGQLIEFGEELDIGDTLIEAYKSRNLQARLFVDKPATIYEPHKHAAVKICTIKGNATIRLDGGDWQKIEAGVELRIGDNQLHEANSGDSPWVYVFAASPEEMKRQGL